MVRVPDPTQPAPPPGYLHILILGMIANAAPPTWSALDSDDGGGRRKRGGDRGFRASRRQLNPPQGEGRTPPAPPAGRSSPRTSDGLRMSDGRNGGRDRD